MCNKIIQSNPLVKNEYKIKDSSANYVSLDVLKVGLDMDINNSTYIERLEVAGLIYSKTHDDGWTISGRVVEDWFIWVSEFQASHPIFGSVCGDFNQIVYSDTHEGYDDFLKNHHPSEWDIRDI